MHVHVFIFNICVYTKALYVLKLCIERFSLLDESKMNRTIISGSRLWLVQVT